jgi:hypothetical protein
MTIPLGRRAVLHGSYCHPDARPRLATLVERRRLLKAKCTHYRPSFTTPQATLPRWTRLSGSLTRNTCCQASGEVSPERRAGRVSGHRIDILSTWHPGGIVYTISMTNGAPDAKRTVRFQLVLSDEETELLDGWQFANRIRTRSDALRTLIRLAPQQPPEATKGSEPARGQDIVSRGPHVR